MWFTGPLIYICGNVAVNFSTNLLKYSHRHENSFTYKLAISLFLVSNISNFFTLSSSSQALLSALSSIQFVSNVVFGKILLKIPPTLTTIICTAIIIIGNLLIVYSSPHSSTKHTYQEIIALFQSADDIYYGICLFAVISATLAAQYFVFGSPDHRNRHYGAYCCFAILSGSIGAHSVLFGKITSSLLFLTFKGNNQLNHYVFYIVLALGVFTTVFWVYRMNQALKLFTGNVILSMLQVVWIIVSIVSGGVFFHEFYGMSAHEIAVFIVGILVIVSGVVALCIDSIVHPQRLSNMDGCCAMVTEFSLDDTPDDEYIVL